MFSLLWRRSDYLIDRLPFRPKLSTRHCTPELRRVLYGELLRSLFRAYLGASIPCFSHPGLVQAVLLLSSVLFLLLSPLPLTARQWTARTRLSPMRTRRQWTRSTRSMAHSDELLASTPEENSRIHANMSARSFWERTLVRRTRDVLEFGTTQPYRLYIVRFFSSCKLSVTHLCNKMDSYDDCRQRLDPTYRDSRLPL